MIVAVSEEINASLYGRSLQDCVDALFRPIAQDGFWCEEEGRIIRSLHFQLKENEQVFWQPNWKVLHRYAPFALMGVACWRSSSLGQTTYDTKFLRNLEYYQRLTQQADVRVTMPSYGVGPLIYAFGRARLIWPDRDFGQTAEDLAEFALSKYRFRFNEDALILMGVSARGKELSMPYRERLGSLRDSMKASQDCQGLFRWANEPTSFKHQNQMYMLWGLAHTDLALHQNTSIETIRKCLEYTIRERFRSDGALLWHHYRNPVHRAYALIRGALDQSYEPEHRCLFSVHQAFFVYAVQLYKKLSEDVRFDQSVVEAMKWLYGGNTLRKSMFNLTGAGFPWRIMTTDGRIKIASHQFVGAYEIGAMILALVSLLDPESI